METINIGTKGRMKEKCEKEDANVCGDHRRPDDGSKKSRCCYFSGVTIFQM